MQSSLSRQLQTLKSHDTARKLKTNKIASLLFSPSEAGNFDNDLIKSLGAQGLENLIPANPHFGFIKDKIFDPKFDNLSREMLTEDENSRLSEDLKSIFPELLPYFLNEDCQKVIEYLIRNFEIHNYEGSELAITFLPFHSTIIYVRLMQNIDLTKDPHWYFLEKNIKEGLIIPRDIIAKQSSLDSSILESILKLAADNIRSHSKYLSESKEIYLSAVKPTSTKRLVKDDCVVTFATGLITETLFYAKERKRVTENLLIIIMKYISVCLKSSQYEDAFHSGLITLSSLALTSQFSEEYMRAILVDTAKGLQKFPDNKAICSNIVAFFVLIAQTQNVKFSSGLLNLIFISKTLVVDNLKVLGRRYSLVAFAMKLVQGFFDLQLQDKKKLSEDFIEVAEQTLDLVTKNDRKLEAKVSKESLLDSFLTLTLASLLQEQSIGPELSNFCLMLRKIFPDVITETLENCLNKVKDLEAYNEPIVKKFIEASFSKAYATYFFEEEEEDDKDQIEEADGDNLNNQARTLFQGVNSSKNGTRLKAVKKICAILVSESGMEDMSSQSNFNDFLLEMLIKRVHLNDNTEILHEITESSLLFRDVSTPLKLKLYMSYLASLNSFFARNRNKKLESLSFHHHELTYLLVNSDLYQTAGGARKNAIVDVIVKALEQESFDKVVVQNWDHFARNLPCFEQVKIQKPKDHLKTLLFKACLDLENLNLNALISELGNHQDPESFGFFIRGLDLIVHQAQLKSLLTKEFTLLSLLQVIRKKSAAIRQHPDTINLSKTLYNKLIEYHQGGSANKSQEERVNCLKVEILRGMMQVNEADYPFLKEVLDSLGHNSVKILLYLLRNSDSDLVSINALIFLQNEIETKGDVYDLAELCTYLVTSYHRSNVEVRSLVFESIENLLPLLKKQEELVVAAEKIKEYYNTKEIRAHSKHFQDQNKEANYLSAKVETPAIAAEHVIGFSKQLLVFKNPLLKSNELLTSGSLYKRGDNKPEEFLWLLSYSLNALAHLKQTEITSLLGFVGEIVKNLPKSKALQAATNSFLSGFQVLAEGAFKHETNDSLEKFLAEFLGFYVRVFAASSLEVQESHLSFYLSIPINATAVIKNETALSLWITSLKPEHFSKFSSEHQEAIFSVYLQLAAKVGYYHVIQLIEQSRELNIPEGLISKVLSSKISDNTKSGKLSLLKVKKELEFVMELMLATQTESTEIYKTLFSLLKQGINQKQDELYEAEYLLKLILKVELKILSAHLVSSKAKKESNLEKTLLGPVESKSDDPQNIVVLKQLIKIFQNRDSLAENPSTWGILRDSNLLLVWMANINFHRATLAIVDTFTFLFKKAELQTPRLQINSLNLLCEVLKSLVQNTKDANLHSFSRVFLSIATLYSSRVQYRENEQITGAIKKLFEIFGPQNLTLFLNPIISTLITETKKGKNIDQNVSKNLRYTLQLVLESSKIEDNLSFFSSLFQNCLLLLSFFLKKVYGFKIPVARTKLQAGVGGKTLIKNLNIKTTTDLKAFITLSLEFFSLSLNSKTFIQNLSTALLKGDLTKQSVFERLQKLLELQFDCEHAIQHSLSKIKPVKIEENQEEKPKADKSRTTQKKFLKRILGIIQGHISSMSTILPLDSIVKIVSSGVTNPQNEHNLRIKTKLLQFLNDKLAVTPSFKSSADFIQELIFHLSNELIETRKAKKTEVYDDETITYLQSIFLLFSMMLRKKPKTFEKAIKDEALSFISEPNLYLKTISIYTASLYFEKFGFKKLNYLKPLVHQIQISLAVFLYSGDEDDTSVFSNEAVLKAIPELSQISEEARGLTGQLKTRKLNNYKEMCVNLALNSISLLVRSLKDLLAPYTPSLIYLLSNYEGFSKVEEIMAQFAESYEARNLIEIIPTLTEIGSQLQSDYMKNIGILMNNLCSRIEKEVYDAKLNTLFKIFLTAFDLSRRYAAENTDHFSLEVYQNFEGVDTLWIEAFGKFAVKSNEVELKKMYLKLQNWSNKVFADEENQFSFYRKIVLFKLVSHLFDVLKSYFVSFVGFFFDFMLEQLDHYAEIFGEESKKLRRYLTQNELRVYQESAMHKLILNVLTKCFQHDKDEFIDANRFDRLISPLVNQIDALNILGVEYTAFIAENLTPCILELFELVKDDYKWKSLVYQILLKTRSESVKVRLATVKLVSRIVEQLKDRVVSLMSDLLPFMAELLEDENTQIEKESKDIVIRLEQLTGEDVKEYLRS